MLGSPKAVHGVDETGLRCFCGHGVLGYCSTAWPFSLFPVGSWKLRQGAGAKPARMGHELSLEPRLQFRR
jgi:hypothetical protein